MTVASAVRSLLGRFYSVVDRLRRDEFWLGPRHQADGRARPDRFPAQACHAKVESRPKGRGSPTGAKSYVLSRHQRAGFVHVYVVLCL